LNKYYVSNIISKLIRVKLRLKIKNPKYTNFSEINPFTSKSSIFQFYEVLITRKKRKYGIRFSIYSSGKCLVHYHYFSYKMLHIFKKHKEKVTQYSINGSIV